MEQKQEAHGPHRSPKKTVPIDKHMIIVMLINRRIFFLLYENGMVLNLNKLESPSPKDAFLQVWLKLAWWFWRGRWKCKKFTKKTTTMDNIQIVIRRAHASLQLRWAKNLNTCKHGHSGINSQTWSNQTFYLSEYILKF